MTEEKRAQLPATAPRAWHGMSAGVWFPLLFRNRFAVSPPWWGLATTISLISVVNSSLKVVSEMAYGGRLRNAPAPRPPLFVVGHWRTGTTWLHELLVKDERFSFPTTYQCMAPSHFLLTDGLLSGWVDYLMPRRRPMDNMLVGTQLPQEDEFALMNLGVKSPYLEWAFANRDNFWDDYLALSELSADERGRWKEKFRWFVRRLNLRDQRRLVLKSPGHTARIKTLLEVFPDAQFIHIVRDPCSFIPSTIRTWTRLADSLSLQVRQDPVSTERIFARFEAMYAHFDRDRHLLDESNFCEIRYEDLVAQPLEEVEKIYQQLSLGDFDPARPAMEAYLQGRAGYRPNRHDVGDALLAEIKARCGDYAQRYGYDLAPAPKARPKYANSSHHAPRDE